MRKRVFYIIAMLLVVFFSLNNDVISAETISNVNEKIRKLEKEQSEIQSKTNEISKGKKEVNEKMDANKAEQSTVQEKLEGIEADLVVTRAEIQSVTANITSTERELSELKSEIKLLNSEIKDLEQRIKERNILLKDRLRSIQENGGKSQFISVLLGAQNFTDFIMRTTAVNTIMDQDRHIMEEHEQDQIALEKKKTEVEAKKADVEIKMAELQGQKSKLDALKIQLDGQKAEQAELKKELEVEYEELEHAELTLAEEQSLIAAEAAVIEQAKKLAVQEKARLEKEAEEARLKQQANQSGNEQVSAPAVSGSGFIRPASGYVSSEFGYRIHPIYKDRRLHSGIDLAGNSGASIVASNSGVVAHAGWLGAYGNTVTISHGSVTTLYAHMSSISVSPGQVVKRGDVIGRVGSTGDSTGPHLHFEVRTSGGDRNSAQNPRNYVNF